MSLQIVGHEIKKKFNSLIGRGSSRSLHESAATQLLYSFVQKERTLDDGKTVTEEVLDVMARTRLPSPSSTAVLLSFARDLDALLGVGYGTPLFDVNDDYMVAMISKDGEGRKEYVSVAGASAFLEASKQESNLTQKVIEA